jgi:BirA family biotin operon repressor/biotin-[acetyl-CoA-carboxylase] ligase
VNFRRFDHGAVDSTSERAFAAIADGSARHGDVHVAREQLAGRGRRGASWHSAAGEGLYMSIVLLPPPPPLHAAALTMAGGLAVYDVVRELGVERAALKWPNDVVVAGAKLAGVLVETRGLDVERPHYVVGIGVNVRQSSFPRELIAQRAVTSLALEGCDVALEFVRDSVLRELARRLADVREPALELTRDFLHATGLRDRQVRAELAGREIAGRARDLTLAGGLSIERADGTRAALPLEHVRQVVALGP